MKLLIINILLTFALLMMANIFENPITRHPNKNWFRNWNTFQSSFVNEIIILLGIIGIINILIIQL